MPRSRTDMMQMYRIAKMYYMDHMTQEQIAAEENISRSQISRLLEQARTRGIVEINVRMPERISLNELRRDLIRELRLKDVAIAPFEESTSEEDLIEAIATAAATFLPKELKSCRTVGVGWGRTVYRTSCVLSHRGAESEKLLVPLIGVSGTDNPALQVNAILDRLGERLRAHTYFVNTPAFRESTVVFSDLEKKRLQQLHKYWDDLDAAIIGLGAPPGTKRFFVSEIPFRFASRIKSEKAIGDVLSQFYRADGSLIPEVPGFERTAFDAAALRQIPKVICLAGGRDKVPALIAGSRAGFYNMLVTDSVTAEAIYDAIRRESR